MRFSFARSANRGVSRGTGAVRGGVATLTAGGGTAAARGVLFVVKGFLPPLPPLYGCRLAGFLFASCMAMVMIFCRSGLLGRLMRENMQRPKTFV